MDFDDSPEEAAFRQECRTWLAANAKLRTPGIAEVWRTLRPRDEGEDDASLLVGKRWQALKAAVSEAIVVQGGTISHQHGVGKDHAPYLGVEKGAAGLAAIDAAIAHFDPEGRFNSGNLR